MKAAALDPRALAALIFGAVLIGLAPIFVRLSDVGPVAAAFWRCFLAWPVLALALRREAKPAAAVQASSAYPLLVGAGLFFASDLALWHYAIGYTTVGNATLLANMAPLFVAPAAWLLWRERTTRLFLLGLAVAVLGTVILIGDGANLDRTHLTGDALAVAAAAFYAGYLLTVARLRQTYSALRIMSWSSGTVAAVLLPIAMLTGETILPSSVNGWLVLAGLALLSHALGQGLIAQSLATLPTAFSAAGLFVQPLAAAVFAWLILHEHFGWQQAMGGAVILAGIFCCRLGSPDMSARASG